LGFVRLGPHFQRSQELLQKIHPIQGGFRTHPYRQNIFIPGDICGLFVVIKGPTPTRPAPTRNARPNLLSDKDLTNCIRSPLEACCASGLSQCALTLVRFPRRIGILLLPTGNFSCVREHFYTITCRGVRWHGQFSNFMSIQGSLLYPYIWYS